MNENKLNEYIDLFLIECIRKTEEFKEYAFLNKLNNLKTEDYKRIYIEIFSNKKYALSVSFKQIDNKVKIVVYYKNTIYTKDFEVIYE